MAVKPIPDGYHTVTPYLVVDGADKVIEFAKQAFDGQELVRFDSPDGKVAHAEIKIGDSIVMLGEASTSDQGASLPGVLNLYVEDVDKTYAKALEAGGTSLREVADQFFGDRTGGVQDPAGNQWWISTHVEDVSGEELAKRAAEAQQS
jgi:uncharacterized glyoxalase superfamily protein PhnB